MAQARLGEIRIETLEPMRVACFRSSGKEPEHVALGYLKRWLLDRGVKDPASVRIFGFDVEVGEADRERGLRGYEAWASVPAGIRPSEGVSVRSFPGGLFAVLRVRDALLDPFARIPPAWGRLSEWAQSNAEYRLAAGPCLEEEILEDGAIHLDLFLPVASALPRRMPARASR